MVKSKVKRTKRMSSQQVQRTKRVQRTSKRVKRVKRVKRTRRSFLKNKRKTQKRGRVLMGGMSQNRDPDSKASTIRKGILQLEGEIISVGREIKKLEPLAADPSGWSDGSAQVYDDGRKELYQIQDKKELIKKKGIELKRLKESFKKEEERIVMMGEIKRDTGGGYANMPETLNVSIRTVIRVSLNVYLLNGQIFEVSVPVNGTVKDIKEEIFKLKKIPVNEQRLMVGREELINILTIKRNINSDSKLSLILKSPTVEEEEEEDQGVRECELSDLEPFAVELTVEGILVRMTVEEFKIRILADLYPTAQYTSDHNRQLFQSIETDKSLTRLQKDMKYAEEVFVFAPAPQSEKIELYYLRGDIMTPFENRKTLLSYGINFNTIGDYEIIAVFKTQLESPVYKAEVQRQAEARMAVEAGARMPETDEEDKGDLWGDDVDVEEARMGEAGTLTRVTQGVGGVGQNPTESRTVGNYTGFWTEPGLSAEQRAVLIQRDNRAFLSGR